MENARSSALLIEIRRDDLMAMQIRSGWMSSVHVKRVLWCCCTTSEDERLDGEDDMLWYKQRV